MTRNGWTTTTVARVGAEGETNGVEVRALRRAALELGVRRLGLIVAQEYGVRPGALVAYTRTKDDVAARQALYSLLRRVCGWPCARIARCLKRDHSTVCYGAKRAAWRRATYGEHAYIMAAIERRILREGQQKEAG